jgi:membrane-anchored protein YejM (alkaline phosphatase superfamily)
MTNLFRLFFPPIIFNFFRRYLIYRHRKKLNYDPRRWWESDKILKCHSNQFKDFFNNFIGEIFTISLQNEVKDCVIIKPFQKKIFVLKKKTDDACQILLEFGNVEKKIAGNYHVYSNNNKISDIASPAGNQWNCIWIDRKIISSKFEIINNSNKDMYFALPRTIYFKNISEKIDNIIFLVMDQVDQKFFDSLEKKNCLKNITRFFKEGISYTNCFAAGDWTVPCFTSLFTGQQPSYHAFNDLKYSHDLENTMSVDNIFTLASENKFDTFCISKSKGHNPLFGLQKFVNRYFFFDDIQGKTDDDDDTFLGKLIDHMEANKDSKIFAFIHFMKTHAPYYQTSFMEQNRLKNFRIGSPLEEFQNAQIGTGETKIEHYLDKKLFENVRARQAARLERFDIMLDQLFSYLEKNNLMKKTVIILTADHGIPHGLKNKPILNNEWVNVPLKIYHPSFSSSEINSPVSSINIYPLVKAIMKDNYNASNVINPFNKDSNIKFSISESLFNNKYKALIKDSGYEFRITIGYDPIKKYIFLDNILHVEITDGKNVINDKKIYNYFFKILLDNIKKSKIIKAKLILK